MLFGVDLSETFAVSSVVDLFGRGNDVLQILTNICATVCMEIKVEPSSSCSLRAAIIQRSDSDVLHIYIYIYASYASCASVHPSIYASMHLCIYSFVHLFIYLSIYLSIYLWNVSEPHEERPKILVYIYIYNYSFHICCMYILYIGIYYIQYRSLLVVSTYRKTCMHILHIGHTHMCIHS